MITTFLSIQPVIAFGNYFDSLSADSQILLLDTCINSFTVKECCDTTLGACLTMKPECTIAKRLYNFCSWLIMQNDPYIDILTQLDKRYKSFFGPDSFTIAPPFLQAAGDSASPIIITAYISASCPLCKRVCIPLYLSVADDGPIAHRAQLSLKPFTTRIGDRALMAANAQGKFWEYYLSLEKEKKRLDKRIVKNKAKKIGLDMKRFEKDLTSKEFENRLIQFREEALANGVTISPTLFINNRRYQSYKDPQWVIDAVDYEYHENKE